MSPLGPAEVVALCVLAGVAASWVERARARKERAALLSQKHKAEELVDQIRVQLAGCGVAARGGLDPLQVAPRGSYGWSPSYQDVVDLRREVDARRQACEHAVEELEECESAAAPYIVGPAKRAKQILVAVRAARAFGPSKPEDVIEIDLRREPERPKE